MVRGDVVVFFQQLFDKHLFSAQGKQLIPSG